MLTRFARLTIPKELARLTRHARIAKLAKLAKHSTITRNPARLPSRANRSSPFPALMFVTLLALVLSACGTTQGGSSAGGPGASDPAAGSSGASSSGAAGSDKTVSGTAAAGAASAPAEESRTIKHAMGETVIQGTPKRVVILTQEGTEALLELGVKPVGAVESGLGNGWFPHIAKEMQGVTELGDEAQPNVELIVGLKPDLIIGNKVRHEKIYNQLKEIAPTVFATTLSGRWKENFALYAETLGKTKEGEQAIAKYDERVKQAKRKLGDKVVKKVSLVRFLPTAVRIYQKDTFAGIILSDIGFARPAAQDKDNFMEVITKERIADMDGDIMFYFNADYDETKGGTKNQEEWMKDPLYKNLNIAKKNMAFKVDEVIWNLSGGIRSANMLVDELVKHAEKL